MKIFCIVFVFVGIFFDSSKGLSCWECDNAHSDKECVEIGRLRQCHANENSCQTEIRRIGWGPALLISKRCKQSLACHNNFIQNPRPAWFKYQCNLRSPSAVCRCCCSSDECNRDGFVCWDEDEDADKCLPKHTNLVNGAVTCTDGNAINSDCTFECDEGFILSGQALITCLTSLEWNSPAPRCSEISCPFLASPDNGDVSCTNQQSIGSLCTFTCDDGFTLDGASQSTCEMGLSLEQGGAWSNPTPTCFRSDDNSFIATDVQLCESEMSGPENGMVLCSDGMNLGSVCDFTCNRGFLLFGEESSTCIKDATIVRWQHPTPTCREQDNASYRCSPDSFFIENGKVTCSNDNFLESECRFSCNNGYGIDGSPSTICIESNERDGRWSNPAPACTVLLCNPPHMAPNDGSVSCTDDNRAGSLCSFTCFAGFQLVGKPISACEIGSNSRVFWTSDAPICVGMTCPEGPGIPLNGNTFCNDGTNIGSECGFTCDSGFVLIGEMGSECINNGNGDMMWSNPVPECQVSLCNPRHDTIDGGQVFCTNENLVGSLCAFTCYMGNKLFGESLTECVTAPGFGAMWSNEVPSCRKMHCPPGPGMPLNGNTFCSNENVLGSKCNFTCQPSFEQIGADGSDCIENQEGEILWSNRVPECKPNPCNDPSVFPHGRSSCTNGGQHNSVCTFECTDLDYHIYPPTFIQNTCYEESGWDIPIPCCAQDCPPHAVMDFIIVLDSSSSVGMENWIKMTNFIASFLEVFTVSSSYTVYGIFRYNRDVDADTQILLKDYPDNKDDLITAFRDIPYDGMGTHTGNAIKHVNDVMLAPENGNREEVRDVVLIITDGSSQDDVDDESKRLRDSGALVYVVPIRPPQGGLDMDQVLQIAGKDDYIFKDALERGFEALTTDLSAKLASIICGNPCDHVLHDHD